MDMHVQHLVELYLRSLQISGQAQGTITKYKTHLVVFANFIELEGQGIPTMEEAILIFLAGLKCADQTKASYWRSIRAFLRWCADPEQGYMEPLSPKLKPRFKPARPRLVPAKADVIDVLNALPKATKSERRDRALFHFLYFTGCRAGEALRLRVDDLDFNQCAVVIYAPKVNRYRVIPLAKPLQKIMFSWVGHLPGSHMFPCFDGTDPDRPLGLRTAERRWETHQHSIRARQVLTLHDLRRAFTTHLRSAGFGDMDLKDLLGHSSLATTQLYARFDYASAGEKMEGVWG